MKAISVASAIAVVASSIVGCALDSGPESEELAAVTQPLLHGDRCIEIVERRNAQTWLGSSTGDCVEQNNGSFKPYQNGTLLMHANDVAPSNNANPPPFIVQGLIRATYDSVGGANSPLGYPTTDESNPLFGGGKYNGFHNGSILWKNAAPQAFEVHGAIAFQFARLGNEWGSMGWPTSNEQALSGSRRRNHFESGKIYWKSTTGPWPVLTRTNPDAKFNQVPGQPQITSVTVTPMGSGEAKITATGINFTPGKNVSLRTTHPQNGTVWMTNAVAASNGTVSWPQTAGNLQFNQIPTVSDVATIWAFQDHNQLQAAFAKGIVHPTLGMPVTAD